MSNFWRDDDEKEKLEVYEVFLPIAILASCRTFRSLNGQSIYQVLNILRSHLPNHERWSDKTSL